MSKEKKSKEEIIEKALLGGIVGAALGALLTGKAKGTLVSAIAGAAIGASLKAIEEAKHINTPVMYEEDGKIFKVYADGRKEFVKAIKESKIKIPENFRIA